jgi:hypothetical protein
MNKLFSAAVLALMASTSQAQQYATTFAITNGIGIGENYTQLTLDVALTKRYMSAHGVVTLDSGISVPVTGTCFSTAGGGILCNLSLGSWTLVVDIGSTLNGTLKMVNDAGSLVDSAPLTFVSIS